MAEARYDSFAQYYERIMGPLQRRGLVRLREETISQLPAGLAPQAAPNAQ